MLIHFLSSKIELKRMRKSQQAWLILSTKHVLALFHSTAQLRRKISRWDVPRRTWTYDIEFSFLFLNLDKEFNSRENRLNLTNWVGPNSCNKVWKDCCRCCLSSQMLNFTYLSGRVKDAETVLFMAVKQRVIKGWISDPLVLSWNEGMLCSFSLWLLMSLRIV